MLVDQQLDRVADKGGMDVIRDIAHRLPVIVICDMLGIPEDHRSAFLIGSNVSGRILEPVPMSAEELERANTGTAMANVYFDKLCDLRRREPQDDLTTELVKAEEAGDRLTAEELRANIGLLFGAGHETTTNQLANTFRELLAGRVNYEAICADPALIPNAVEEAFRLYGTVIGWRRRTRRDVVIRGVDIPAQSNLLLSFASANRDAEVFPDPEVFDIRRANARRHLTMGNGIHFCLGAPLARLEMKIVLEEFTKRFPKASLVPHQSLKHFHTFVFRAPEALLVDLEGPREESDP